MHVAALTLIPSLYIPLQAVISTPIYTIEVNNSSGRIEKFNERPSTISIVVFELELKYGINYTEMFAFK